MRPASFFQLGVLLSVMTPVACSAAAAESDDLWAEALVRSWDKRSSLAEVEGLFQNAAAKAGNKAPVFVSMGDYLRIGTIRGMAASVIEDIEDDSEKAAGKSGLELDVANPGDRFSQQIETAAEKISAQGDFIMDAFASADSKSLAAYLQSVAADPGFALGWFRIAAHSGADDPLKEKASARLIQTAPDNALSYCVSAKRQMDAGNVSAALEQIGQANRRRFVVFDNPIPAEVSLRFPDDKESRQSGLAGEPVGREFLRTVADTQGGFATGMESTLGWMARLLVEHADELRKAGNDQGAVECLEAVAELGVTLLNACRSNGDSDTMMVLVGLMVVKRAVEKLEPLHTELNNSKGVARVKRFNLARQAFLEEVRPYLKKQTELIKQLPQGPEQFERMESFRAAEAKFVSEALKTSGLADFRFDD